MASKESKLLWIEEKTARLMKEGKTRAQAVAIASRMWETVHGGN